ncbi:hypothetical protein KCU87_g307, partial [Aureobasidium melanogenum]
MNDDTFSKLFSSLRRHVHEIRSINNKESKSRAHSSHTSQSRIHHQKSAKRKSQSHNSSQTPHQRIDVVRTRHPMGSVALPDCSAEAVSKRSQGHAQQIASYLCEWVATTRFEPGTDGWVVANSRGGKKDWSRFFPRNYSIASSYALVDIVLQFVVAVVVVIIVLRYPVRGRIQNEDVDLSNLSQTPSLINALSLANDKPSRVTRRRSFVSSSRRAKCSASVTWSALGRRCDMATCNCSCASDNGFSSLVTVLTTFFATEMGACGIRANTATVLRSRAMRFPEACNFSNLVMFSSGRISVIALKEMFNVRRLGNLRPKSLGNSCSPQDAISKFWMLCGHSVLLQGQTM